MLCSRIKEVTKKVDNQGTPIGRADLLRIICSECDCGDTCPSLAVQFDQTPSEGSERWTSRKTR